MTNDDIRTNDGPGTPSADARAVRPVNPYAFLLEVEARLRLAGHTTGVWYDRSAALRHVQALLGALDVEHLSLVEAGRGARALAAGVSAPPEVPLKGCCEAVLVGEECGCGSFFAEAVAVYSRPGW